MEVVAGTRQLGRRLRAPVIAIGNFDGVHVGHHRLFAEAKARAAARGGEAVVLTFAPHPARALAPDKAPPLLCTPQRKLDRIARAGMDVCVVEPFDRPFAELSPEQFVDQVLVDGLGASELVVGWDFTFGRDRAGDAARLAQLAAQRGVPVAIVAAVTVDGEVCSSSRVRALLRAGDPAGAARLLGRDPEIDGVVVRGAGRGRTLGVPTANLRPRTELLPAPGVYAGFCTTPRGRFAAAINIGTNPTFTNGNPPEVSVEAHLLDYPGDDLYGSEVTLAVSARLRDEQRFAGAGELVAQIRRDLDAARAATRAEV